MPSPPLTLQDAIKVALDRLKEARLQEPAVEARRLIVEALKLDSAALIRDPDLLLDPVQADSVADWLKRRAGGEPLARIRGWQEFYGRRFDLSDATLEPRADTETLIEATLAIVDSSYGRSHPWRILDVGTGTGCLPITLLAELPHAIATATDISAHAIQTAQRNAEMHGVQSRMTWAVTNLTKDVALDFDFVLSNPPYIKSDDILTLQTEVVSFDPHVALDGGATGLSCYEELGSQLCAANWCGHLIVEIAANDHERVLTVFEEQGLKVNRDRLQLWRDLSGHVRCVAIETLC